MSTTTNSVNLLSPPSPAPSPSASPPRADAQPAGKGSFLAWLRRAYPTMLVLLALAAIGVIGHQTHWTIPKFSELFGTGAAEKDDWCAEHSVPESICVECNGALMSKSKDYGWCSTHRVANCPFEHPDVAQLKVVPRIDQADLDRAERALALKDRPDNSAKCKLYHRRLQFASKEAFDKTGIDVRSASRGYIAETISASGEITYEQPRVAPVHIPLTGRVRLVTEKGLVGTHVKKGAVLALVDAPEVGKAKAEFLQALAQHDLKSTTLENLKPLLSKGIVNEARILEAETALREANASLVYTREILANLGVPIELKEVRGLAPDEIGKRLKYAGLPDEVIPLLTGEAAAANVLAVRAARDGVVTSAQVVPGQSVDPAKTLFVIADTSRMWLMLHVRQDDEKYLQVTDPKTGAPGQTVIFHPDGRKEHIKGELVWRGTAIDERTRTVQVRADLANPNGRLLAHTYGTGKIIIRAESEAIVVPKAAVHWEGDCHVVFVRDKNWFQPDGPKVFHVRTVRPGVDYGEGTDTVTEIIAGLLPAEVVATTNSAVLRAELLKNRLGEG